MYEWNEYLKGTRKGQKLIHHITNYVTVNDCANVTLAMGASPVMADAKEEVADMVKISDALVLNIGTLNTEKIESMIIAGKAANEKGIPVIFDPVGCGATLFRTEMTKRLLQEIKMAVIRGNISEMMVIAGMLTVTKGVDATLADTERDAGYIARRVANEQDVISAITGAVDVISDGKALFSIRNGVPEMSRITGTGCMCTSLIASFCASNEKQFLPATVAAVSLMGVAGEYAKEKSGSNGLGHFHMALIDAIGTISYGEWEKRRRIDEKY